MQQLQTPETHSQSRSNNLPLPAKVCSKPFGASVRIGISWKRLPAYMAIINNAKAQNQGIY